jgi:hypothetical protein
LAPLLLKALLLAQAFLLGLAALPLQLLALKITPDRLIFGAVAQPEALETCAGKGAHLKNLTQRSALGPTKREETLGESVAQTKAKAHHDWTLPQRRALGPGLGLRLNHESRLEANPAPQATAAPPLAPHHPIAATGRTTTRNPRVRSGGHRL